MQNHLLLPPFLSYCKPQIGMESTTKPYPPRGGRRNSAQVTASPLTTFPTQKTNAWHKGIHIIRELWIWGDTVMESDVQQRMASEWETGYIRMYQDAAALSQLFCLFWEDVYVLPHFTCCCSACFLYITYVCVLLCLSLQELNTSQSC